MSGAEIGEREGLVGRACELDACTEALDSRRPLAVIGEAGVGKTSLVRSAAGRRGRGLVEARAFATLSWMPYFPVRQALGEDPGGADPAYVAQALEERHGTSVILLDDLHWADEHTCEVARLLAGRVAVVTTLRSDEPGSRRLLDESLAGFERLSVEPLAPDDADALLARLRPELGRPVRTAIVARAAGNPLMLEELAAGPTSESFERSLFARIHAHGPEVRNLLELLAAAGRPLGVSEVPAIGSLAATGLVEASSGSVSFRHPLLGEIVHARIPPERLTELHAHLARLVTDPGEAARHFAAAGEPARAVALALEAADATLLAGEKAEHLLVAASCAADPDAGRIRLRAASALTEAGRFDDAAQVLDELTPTDQAIAAEILLLRARGDLENDRLDRVDELLAAAADLAPDTTVGVGLAVAIEQLDRRLDAEHDSDVLAAASALLAAAREGGSSLARAHALRAQARWEAGEPGAEEDFQRALDLASASHDVALGCQIAERAINPLFHDGRRRQALATCRRQAARAREQRLASWERRFRTRAAWLLMHGGRYRAAHEELEGLLTEPLEWDRYLATYVAAQVSIDLGRFDRTQQLVAELHEMGRAGHHRRRQALWANADLLAWSGRPGDAVRVFDEMLAEFPHSMFARVTRSWALVDLGLEVDTQPIDDDTPPRLWSGAIVELEAVRLLARGQADEAARLFRDAAARWRNHHERGRLRCAWAEGEALRRAGREHAAVVALARAERLVKLYGHEPLLARVHRSLRLVGVRRSAPRGVSGTTLTPREREMLVLVGAGLSIAQIAARLGIGRPTVARTLGTARRKLGAATSLEAAARAAGAGDDG